MTGQADVSVIIPAYNCAGFIGRALASVRAQSHSPREIIVLDDCSTDETRSVVAAVAEADPRIRLIALSRNGGPSLARNAGIEAAQGRWLAILDADDAYAPDRLAQLIPFGEATGADLVADDLAYYDAGADRITGRGMGKAEPVPDGTISLRDYVAHNLATGRSFDWGLLKPIFRRDTLLRLGLRYDPALRHGEDFKFMMELLAAGADFRILNRPLYLYTQRQGAVSGRSSGMTRTTIGYAALRDASLALAQDPRIASDPELVDLLGQRARGLGRLDDAHFVSTATRAAAFGPILARIIREPAFLPLMIKQFWQAARRRLARQ